MPIQLFRHRGCLDAPCASLCIVQWQCRCGSICPPKLPQPRFALSWTWLHECWIWHTCKTCIANLLVCLIQAYDRTRMGTATPMQSPSDTHMTTPGSVSHEAEREPSGCGLGANVDVLVCRAEWYYHVGAYQVRPCVIPAFSYLGILSEISGNCSFTTKLSNFHGCDGIQRLLSYLRDSAPEFAA